MISSCANYHHQVLLFENFTAVHTMQNACASYQLIQTVFCCAFCD